jgi:cytochrome c-type biogenesis protein CcmF
VTGPIGAYLLALALCGAVLTAVAGARQALVARAADADAGPAPASTAARVVRVGAAISFLGAAGAMAVLEVALVRHDFSVRFVAEHGSVSTPLYYTLTSPWAGADGSLLLWNLVLTGYLAVLALRPPPAGRAAPELHGWAVAVVAGAGAFFLGIALFAGNVFDRVSPVPVDGPGPTPLLQDHPAMGIHPPLLYLGLVGLVVPFAWAVAALASGATGRSWLDAGAGTLRVAWTALTAGILLGAWWSYAVLGWGGYWAWDPVENASLMPWLLATALLHSAAVQRRRGALPAWNLSLAVGAFLLAALGVLLTRSGAVTSVHAFADSEVGPLLLGFVAALVVGVVALVALGAARGPEPGSTGAGWSRPTALLANNVVLVALTVTVFVGTLLPVVTEATGGGRVVVGPPFYDRMAVPLALLLLALMAVGPVLRWGADDPSRVLRRLAGPLVLGAAVCVATVVLAPGSPAAAVALGLATLVVASAAFETYAELAAARRGARATDADPSAAGDGRGRPRAAYLASLLRRRRRVLAGRLVHIGVAVLAVGVAGSAAWTAAVEQELATGETVSVSGASATLVGVERDRDERRMRTAARFRLEGPGVPGGTVAEPSLRYFPAHDTTVAGPAVVGGVRSDVYLTLLAVDPDAGTATVRLAVNPLVGWIWAGGVLMVLGSLVAAVPGRTRRRTPSPGRPTGPVPRSGTTGPTREEVPA